MQSELKKRASLQSSEVHAGSPKLLALEVKGSANELEGAQVNSFEMHASTQKKECTQRDRTNNS